MIYVCLIQHLAVVHEFSWPSGFADKSMSGVGVCLEESVFFFKHTNTKWLHLSVPCYLVFTLLKFFTKTEPNKQCIESRKKV